MTVLLALLVVFAAASITGAATEQTPLCDVVATPEAFDGKVVRFRAGILTDWQHGTVLVHTGCQRGIQLTSTDAVPPDESKAFEDAVGTPLDGGRERTAMATFTGRFSLRRSNPKAASGSLFEFSAQRIENVDAHHNKNRR